LELLLLHPIDQVTSKLFALMLHRDGHQQAASISESANQHVLIM
jgi:hypothetical protein